MHTRTSRMSSFCRTAETTAQKRSYVRQKVNTNLEESSSQLDLISVDDVFSSICSGKKRESESYLNRFNIEYTIPELRAEIKCV